MSLRGRRARRVRRMPLECDAGACGGAGNRPKTRAAELYGPPQGPADVCAPTRVFQFVAGTDAAERFSGASIADGAPKGDEVEQ
jgi:hypothetical protein